MYKINIKINKDQNECTENGHNRFADRNEIQEVYLHKVKVWATTDLLSNLNCMQHQITMEIIIYNRKVTENEIKCNMFSQGQFIPE